MTPADASALLSMRLRMPVHYDILRKLKVRFACTFNSTCKCYSSVGPRACALCGLAPNDASTSLTPTLHHRLLVRRALDQYAALP